MGKGLYSRLLEEKKEEESGHQPDTDRPPTTIRDEIERRKRERTSNEENFRKKRIDEYIEEGWKFQRFGTFDLNDYLAACCPQPGCGAGRAEVCNIQSTSEPGAIHLARAKAWIDLEEKPEPVHAARIVEDYARSIYGNRQRAYQKVACPTCQAAIGTPCDLPGHATHPTNIHWKRIDAFLEAKGMTEGQLKERPYIHWPDADEYEKWGVFAHSSSKGGYSDTPTKSKATRKPLVFSSYELAHRYAQKLQRQNEKCYGAFPMIQAQPETKPEGPWIKAAEY